MDTQPHRHVLVCACAHTHHRQKLSLETRCTLQLAAKNMTLDNVRELMNIPLLELVDSSLSKSQTPISYKLNYQRHHNYVSQVNRDTSLRNA